jgi:hypothetical protein
MGSGWTRPGSRGRWNRSMMSRGSPEPAARDRLFEQLQPLRVPASPAPVNFRKSLRRAFFADMIVLSLVSFANGWIGIDNDSEKRS